MGDIELVIKIPKEDFYRIASGFGQEEDAVLLEKIFKNATPLIMVLEKIKADIEKHSYPVRYDHNSIEKGMTLTGIMQVLSEYKTESEDGERR